MFVLIRQQIMGPNSLLETVKDLFSQMGMKPLTHLVEISIFSPNHDIVRLTKIMNRADKNGHIFRKESAFKIKVF